MAGQTEVMRRYRNVVEAPLVNNDPEVRDAARLYILRKVEDFDDAVDVLRALGLAEDTR